ncbi:hypothetical protein Cylst_2636 [Cylindrospermum stagnale PCC 7417]|uniref:Uncharacterized protein n=1 Tax=Cylindrospermum stagnale PCC 7417 TaxID=56107 RepID=K9WWT9_9NOST|nr:hypothetical protein Cylst_2636 [Cylindrospermum stagnale PCC 7417]
MPRLLLVLKNILMLLCLFLDVLFGTKYREYGYSIYKAIGCNIQSRSIQKILSRQTSASVSLPHFVLHTIEKRYITLQKSYSQVDTTRNKSGISPWDKGNSNMVSR